MIFPMVAGGNIPPFVFVQQVTTQPNQCIIAASGAKVIGVSPRYTRHPPGAFFNDDGYAAIATEDIQIFSENETCMIQIGTGGCAAGDYLKPDAGGTGTAIVASTGNFYGAIASRAAAAGDLIEVQVHIGTL
jgi:hypothetical protein